jgi:DNA-binding NtrC family response regulator
MNSATSRIDSERRPHLMDKPSEAVRCFERQQIERVQRRVPDKKEAARLLGVGVSSLYRRIAELGIQIS